MDKKVVLGFTGKKFHGKTTCANWTSNLLRQYGRKTVIVAFAEPLKSLVTSLLFETEWSRNLDTKLKSGDIPLSGTVATIVDRLNRFLIDYNMPHLDPSEIEFIDVLLKLNKSNPGYIYRKMLQFVGTEIVRQRQPSFWTDLLVESIRDNQSDIVLVDDLRFEDELYALKKFPGFNVYLIRTNIEDDNDTHVSETSVEDIGNLCEYVFEHDNLDELRQVAELIAPLANQLWLHVNR